jgi:hypothetical protein
MADFTKKEQEWWIENPKEYSCYEDIPPQAKWLARVSGVDGHSERTLEISTGWQMHLLPGNYCAPLMLLNMQELACMAESFDAATSSRKRARLWQNIHFLWHLREDIVTTPGLRHIGKDSLHPLLKRWLIRLLHGFPNSEGKNAKDLQIPYNRYEQAGKLEQGKCIMKAN